MSSPQDALEGGEFAEPSWQCQLICEMGTVMMALVGLVQKASQGAWDTVSAQFVVADVTCRVALLGRLARCDMLCPTAHQSQAQHLTYATGKLWA